MNQDGCIICGAPLEYLEKAEEMECSVCGKKVMSRARCVHGHFVCDECHTEGLGGITGLCMSETSKDPVEILEKMMDMPFCHMHGPEHHVMTGAALMTAYVNAGGDAGLESGLKEMIARGRQVPGGTCGFWGACGAGIGAGIFVSVVTGSTPLDEAGFGLSNMMTAAALEEIGKIGGPRCCKRNSYIALMTAVDFARERLGVMMEKTVPSCSRQDRNKECIGARCPFI